MIKLDGFSKALAGKVLELTKEEGLPNDLLLDIETLICLNLIEQLQSETISLESLINEAKELGIPQEVDINHGLEALAEKGYLRAVAEGSFEPLPPLQKAFETLKRIFPSMHGISMLAYLVQTLEEVISGRKELSHAVTQFADTLEIHSRSPSKGPSPRDGAAKPSADILRELKERAQKRAEGASRSSSNLLSQDEGISAKGFDVFDLFGGEEKDQEREPALEAETMPSDEPEHDEQPPPGSLFKDKGDTSLIQDEEDQENESAEGAEEVDLEDLEMEGPPPELKPDMEVIEGRHASAETTDLHRGEEAFPQENTPPVDAGADTLLEPLPDEEALEERIRRFEQELAQLCPLCGKGRIQERQTASGKKYYQCDQKVCQFISWGKPLSMPCPRCNNPFLVEIESDSGLTIAKCPRATCGYKGDPSGKAPSKSSSAAHPRLPPGPKVLAKAKKRRVRRRVVRKR